jgi:hypothetical protein
MQYRIQHGFLWTALHALGCLFGFFVLGYALYTWAGYGFSLGPNHHVHPDAPDPSLGARYFLLAGLTLAAYCAFAQSIPSFGATPARATLMMTPSPASNQSMKPTAH